MAIIDDVWALPDHLVMDADWAGYMRVLKELDRGERRGVRVTYDRGKLEIVPVSKEHGMADMLLSTLVQALLDELGVDYDGGANITFNRRSLDRGFQPDASFWIESATRLPRNRKVDYRRDPMPDLLVEVEITTSALNKLGIFAAFGIPEVWRYTKEGELQIYVLQAEGTYASVAASPHCPAISADAIAGYIRANRELLTSQMVRGFRTWLKDRLR